MSEQAIANVQASVVVYDDSSKKWIPSGSSGTQGISKVQIFHHLLNNTFRVVGRKTHDHEVVINCAITKGLNYNRTTKTFHQWRDKRQVYGLNFVSPDDAVLFSEAMLKALEIVTANCQPFNHCQNQPAPPMSSGSAVIASTAPGAKDPRPHQNGSLHIATNNNNSVPYRDHQNHQQPQSLHNHHLSTSSTVSSSSGVFYDDKNYTVSQQPQICGDGIDRLILNGMEELCYTVGNMGQAQSFANTGHHQRHSSHGSNGSALSGGSSAVLSNVIYSSTSHCPSSESSRHVAQSSTSPLQAPSPFPAPALTKSGTSAYAAPSAPQPPARPLVSIPAAPPPPAGLCSSGATSSSTTPANNLAQAIASAKLRKTSVKQPPSGSDVIVKENRSASTGSVENSLRISASSQQHSSVISEMAATLARRRLLLQESASANGSSANDENSLKAVDSPAKIYEKEPKKNCDTKNGRMDDRTVAESPRTHRKVPSGSSLSSQEEAALGFSIAPTHSLAGSAASLTNVGGASLTLASAAGLLPQRSMSNGPPTTTVNGGVGCGSSLSSSTSLTTSGLTATLALERQTGPAAISNSTPPSNIDNWAEALEVMKREILLEIRGEILKAKAEIIEALKYEMNRK